MSEKNPRVGSTLESLLREDGLHEDAKNYAVKSVLAYKLARAMEASKSLARRRLRLNRAKLRSTTQRRGGRAKPAAASGRLMVSSRRLPISRNAPPGFCPA